MVMPLSESELNEIRRRLGREPTREELALFEATWSEHCSYKSTRRLLRMLPTEAPWVLVGPGRDAGAVKLFDDVAVVARIESHNHPSAVDPYNGAATGVGGIVRDVLSLGAQPIALLDALYLGSLRTPVSRWLAKGIVRGISDYGNRIGVPTVAGETWFHASYERQPLVNVACIGVTRPGDLLPGRVEPGDVMVLAGNSTGRDGMLGSSFASRPLGSREEDIAAVQVGNPFLEKLLIDALTEAFERKLLRHVKDLGGGGLATAVSETAASSGVGAVVHLDRVHLREPDMEPAEILVSESQERMLLVPWRDKLGELLRLLDRYGVEASVIGYFDDTGRLRAVYRGRVVVDLPVGLAASAPPVERKVEPPPAPRELPGLSLAEEELGWLLERVVSSPRVAGKAWVYEQYDWGVQGRTAAPPGYADAAVLWLRDGTSRGVVAALAGNPRYTRQDPFRGAALSLAEAYRHVAAVGGEPLAALDNINAGNPEKPRQFWYFKRIVEGLAWMARGLGIPFVGGNVSLYNEDEHGHMVDPVASVLVVGRISDVTRATGLALTGEGLLVAVGETRPELGASEAAELLLGEPAGLPPEPRPREEAAAAKLVRRLIEDGLVLASHSVGLGGAAAAVARMAVAGGVGARLDLAALCPACRSPLEAGFSETPGRYILEVPRDSVGEVLRRAGEAGVWASVVGEPGGDYVELASGRRTLARVPLDGLSEAYTTTLEKLMREG